MSMLLAGRQSVVNWVVGACTSKQQSSGEQKLQPALRKVRSKAGKHKQ